MARQGVRAPDQQPPRYGLLTVAPPANGLARERWQNGFEFSRMPCAPGGSGAVNCGGGTDDRDPDSQGFSDLVTGDPIEVWAARRCTLRGFQVNEYEARARAMLASVVSYEVAHEVWTGDIRDAVADADRQDNVALSDAGSDTLTNGPVDPHNALALLVGGLGECNHGGRGMIHVTPQVLQMLVFEGSVYRDGNLWLTAMGHIVVADDGYDGSGPGQVAAGNTQWAYATTMISTVQSEVAVPGAIKDVGGGIDTSWVDKATNTVTVYADQLVAWLYDGCCHLAAEIDLASPLLQGAS